MNMVNDVSCSSLEVVIKLTNQKIYYCHKHKLSIGFL